MGKVIIDKHTIKDPITLIGRTAGYAYGSDVENKDKCYKRGKECIESGHFKMLEFCTVIFVLEGYSNRTIRQLARHTAGGLTMVQESTRYVDFSQGFDYIIPPSIKNCKDSFVIKTYTDAMKTIKEALYTLSAYDIPKEDTQMLIPLGATTKVSIMKNMRNLMDMSRVRMCSLAYWEFRQLMYDLKEALSNYSPEWKELCDMLLKPKCEVVGYCTEKRCCGRKPYKKGE